jgi:hypothetical protein
MNSKLAILLLTCSLALPYNVVGTENSESEAKTIEPIQQAPKLWRAFKAGFYGLLVGVGAVATVTFLLRASKNRGAANSTQQHEDIQKVISTIKDTQVLKTMREVVDQTPENAASPEVKQDVSGMITEQLRKVKPGRG